MQKKKKKLNSSDLDYKEGLKIYKEWQAQNKKLEKQIIGVRRDFPGYGKEQF